MLRDVGRFLFALAMIAFVVGFLLGAYLGVKAGMAMEVHPRAALVAATAFGGGGRV